MRRRDDEDLALDRIDHIGTQPPSDRSLADASTAAAPELRQRTVDQLRTELESIRKRIGDYPEHLANQLRVARSARSEAQGSADEAAAHVAELEPARWRPASMREVLGRLHWRERRELALFAYGLSYEEIATVTDTSYTAVNRWMARGRNALRAADARRHLNHDDPDEPAR
jgi:DNA-directed RNA polymerase specialized sigma24 family protein